MSPELSTPESSPIDVRELLERCMGNIELAERVLAKVESQFEADIAELERAYAERNGKLMAGIAHRLKGSSSNVAAHDLQRCAAEIEELARRESLVEFPAQLEKLRGEWSRIKNASIVPLAASGKNA
jgi:HPt (histidine-containing phosphotransfer) domain-containing protein